MTQGAGRSEVCAVILAGGRSRRIGRNKALFMIKGRTLIENIARLAEPLVDQVIISANDVSTYQFLRFSVFPDIFIGQGPLAGIHSAMANASYPLYLVLACDLPGLTSDLLSQLMQFSEDWDAVVPRTGDGQAHPLCAVYRRSCFEALERRLQAGWNRVHDFLCETSLRVRWIDSSMAPFRDSDLRNINETSDLDAYLRLNGHA